MCEVRIDRPALRSHVQTISWPRVEPGGTDLIGREAIADETLGGLGRSLPLRGATTTLARLLVQARQHPFSPPPLADIKTFGKEMGGLGS
jgi:hypothetical protein